MGNPGWEGNRSETKVSGFAKPRLQALHFHSWQGPPASDHPVFKPLPQFPQPPGRRCPFGRREAWFPGAGQRRPHPPALPPAVMGRARARRGRSAEAGAEAWGSGWPGLQPLLTPPLLPAAPFLHRPLARLHALFTSSHPACTHRARPPHVENSVARPPPPRPTTLSARAAHLAGFRALFFSPPISPTPPGADCAPTHGQGLGSAQARGCTGRARGAGSAWA